MEKKSTILHSDGGPRKTKHSGSRIDTPPKRLKATSNKATAVDLNIKVVGADSDVNPPRVTRKKSGGTSNKATSNKATAVDSTDKDVGADLDINSCRVVRKKGGSDNGSISVAADHKSSGKVFGFCCCLILCLFNFVSSCANFFHLFFL